MQSKTLTTDKSNREDFKNRLLNKVEAATTPPTIESESEPVPVEIVEKHSIWVPARFALEQDEVLPKNKEEEPLFLQRELEKREAIKLGMSNKVEVSLAPPMVESQPEVVIVEKYANWAPAQVTLAPEETLTPEFKTTEVSISPWEAEKRDAIQANPVNKIAKPPVRAEPVVKPVEIIEKYAKGTLPRPLADEPYFPEPIREDHSSRDFNPHSELEKRVAAKSNLLNKVEEAVTIPIVEIEAPSIEIIEKYSNWAPARVAIAPVDELLPEFKTEESVLSPYEAEKRDAVNQRILDKANKPPTAPMVEVEPEIIEKYSNWTPARIALELADGPPSETRTEGSSFNPHSELEKREAIKQSILNKVEGVLAPPVVPEILEVEPEILEKYSTWSPANLSSQPEDGLLPEFKKDELVIVSPYELEKRDAVIQSILDKEAAALIIPDVQEEVEPEIIEKYATWVPATLSSNPDDALLPEFKKEELEIVSPYELEKRDAVKQSILDKEAAALIIPDVQEEIEPEIIEKYSTWSPARTSSKPDNNLLPEFKREELAVFPREAEKRVAIKQGILNKIEEALAPPVVQEVPEPATIEIVEKYTTWVPARIALDTVEDELLPEFKTEEPVLSPYEAEKRDAVNQSILDKANEPPVIPMVEADPEIIEKYSSWTPARVALGTEEGRLPEFKREEPILSPYEAEKRDAVNQSILDQAKPLPITPAVEVDPEIVDKYSTWSPARLSITPEDELPLEFTKDELVILPREAEKRVSIKQSILDKVEEALAPPVVQVDPEPEPVVIVEKHSTWVPAGLALESEELLPEFKKDAPVITPREIEKRQSIKQGISSKIEQSLSPSPMVEVEPEIEIIEKFSKGIPQRLPETADPVFPEARRILSPVSSDLDVPKRLAFKNRLLNKLNSLPEPQEIKNVEVVEYTDRVVNSYGFDFPQIKMAPIKMDAVELQESIVDFKPVTDEPPIPVLLLPDNYGELDERALYGVLIRDKALKHTSETANLALDVLAGRSSKTVEFTIVNLPKAIKPKKFNTPKVRSEVKSEAILEVVPVSPAAHKPTVKEPELIEFNLPSDWQKVPLSTLRTDLLATGATPEQVDAKMASLVQVDEVCPVEFNPEIEELTVNLPDEFKSWKPNSQYIYLTKELKLTPERANSLVFNGAKE